MANSANGGRMTPAEIKLVQSSFQKVVPISDRVAKLFYDRLFEINPPLRQLFSADLTIQRIKLITTLTTIIMGLDQIDAMLPEVRQLAARHVEYGVDNHHYETVGEALLWALEQGLGEDFTPEVKDAWVAAYTFLAEVMTKAADETRAA